MIGVDVHPSAFDLVEIGMFNPEDKHSSSEWGFTGFSGTIKVIIYPLAKVLAQANIEHNSAERG